MGILDRWYDRGGVARDTPAEGAYLRPAEGNSHMYLFIYALEYWNNLFRRLPTSNFGALLSSGFLIVRSLLIVSDVRLSSEVSLGVCYGK